MVHISKEGFHTYNGKIMFPPRTDRAIPPEKIKDYENKGYAAQLKFNGTRTLVEMKPGGEIKLWTRHREPHRAYKLSKGLRANLEELHNAVDPNKHLVLDGELMNNKTKGLKDKFIAFDVLVAADDYFLGASMAQRHQILLDITGESDYHEEETGRNIAIFVRENFWVAETFLFDLENVFKSRIDMDEIEGLVLKKVGAPLEWGHSEMNNSDWQIRCRKPHKNYRF